CTTSGEIRVFEVVSLLSPPRDPNRSATFTMKHFVSALLCVYVVGCGSTHVASLDTPETPMLDEIAVVIASHLNKSVHEISPDLTFAELGADDLDLVEITMDVEDQLNLVIRDDALVAKTGSASANDLCSRLTVRGFAEVASTAPQPESTNSLHPDAAESGVLRNMQVGLYGQLSALPNPDALELVFIPSFEDVRRFKEEEEGRSLTKTEVDDLRASSVVTALPPEMAAKMRRSNSAQPQ
uniref:phosphopantetheine-binding protein n=1 Tax=Stieleria mannarensis TaxID=2755585 RepID=UPI0016026084